MSNSINIHFLNVDQGDSIVIEFCADINRYVVIDSNVVKRNSEFINPAYELLKSKNVQKINSLVISHIHKDHYNGVEHLLRNFEIDRIIIPPILSTKSEIHNKIIKKYEDKVRDLLTRSDDAEINQQANSLAYLIYYLTNNENKIEEVAGRELTLRFPDISETALVYLPLKKIKGILQEKMTRNDFDPNFFPEMNDASIAFMLTCFGYKILFSADSTYNQWRAHKNEMLKYQINNLNVDFLKVPHHGSKNNNNKDLYSYFFRSDTDEKNIFVSANGIKHPDKELFRLIEEFKLSPYCTNLSTWCFGNIVPIKPMNDVPPEIHPWIRSYVEPLPHECQGNILLRITPIETEISSSTGNRCIYRNM